MTEEVAVETTKEGIPVLNIFEELDKLDGNEIDAMVKIMASDAEARMKHFSEMKDPSKIGIYYAAYSRYVVAHRPYSPPKEALVDLIGMKMSVMTQVILDKLPEDIAWALDSAVLTDITANYFKNMVDDAALDGSVDEQKDYPH